jgi:hypothetical protein
MKTSRVVLRVVSLDREVPEHDITVLNPFSSIVVLYVNMLRTGMEGRVACEGNRAVVVAEDAGRVG